MQLRYKKIISRALISIIILCLLTVYILLYTMGGSKATEVIKEASTRNIKLIEQSSVMSDDGELASICVGDKTKPKKILFIHGSPGDWSAWHKLIVNGRLLQEYTLYAYDRPGYGKTTVAATPDLYIQAKAAYQVMKDNSDSTTRWTVVGHSYGGAVVAKLLIDYPTKIEKAILVGPTLSPQLQRPKWYNYLVDFPLIEITMPHDILSSNTEMMGLSTSLQQNEAALASIDIPITHIHGEKDVIVPFQTVAYLKKQKTEGVKYITKKEMNHFTPWTFPYLIVDELVKPE